MIIARPQQQDAPAIHELFTKTIIDAFKQDGISHLVTDISNEIAKQKEHLRIDFRSEGVDAYFLIAKVENQIVGSIAIHTPNPIIREHLKIDFTQVVEIASVYILPDYQRNGIGSALFSSMQTYLKTKSIKEYVLDGGYKKSQQFWIKKLGIPTVTLHNYWGEDKDHMIWHKII